MKEYIKPEIVVIDLKARGLMEDPVGGGVIGGSHNIPEGYENVTEGEGQMSKGETMFNREDYHYSAWETWDE